MENNINGLKLFAAVIAAGFVTAFVGPLFSFFIQNGSILFASVNTRLYIAMSAISLIFILPLAIMVAYPLLLCIERLRNFVMIPISILGAVIFALALAYATTGTMQEKTWSMGTGYGLVFGITLFLFSRSWGEILRIEKPNDD